MDNDSFKQPKEQDVLHFDPAPIMIVRDMEAVKLLEDPNYYLIVSLLREGPMTIPEIEVAYAKAAKKNKQIKPKSYNTIYRYLKALEETKLVVPAGKRVTFGKTASETLFSRTAKLFHYGRYEPHWDKSGRAELFTQYIVQTLGNMYEEHLPSEECLGKWFTEFSTAAGLEIERLVERVDEKTLQRVMSGDWHMMGKVLIYVGMLGVMINQPEVLEKFRDCFRKISSSD